MGDPEIDAMTAVTAALAPLDAGAQGRVIKWAAERYGVAASPAAPAGSVGNAKTGTKTGAKKDTQTAQDLLEVDVDEVAVRAAIENHTGVSGDKLERLFHIDNGVVKILVNHTKLGSSEAEKARTTAQIITVVGKIGLGRPETPLDVIRDECTRKHYYSVKHFANRHMTNIDGFVVKGEGRGSKRLEARPNGISAFPALVDKVLGEA